MRYWLLIGLWACSGEKDGPRPEVCDNGADDDRDSLIDCDDADDCAFLCGEQCGDGLDNDLDGKADCEDEACDGQCPETCDDGRDNDADGLIDCTDSDCGGVCPEDCTDVVDNDADTLVDCADPDCATTCDADGDGSLSPAVGGSDCDDNDPTRSPDLPELCNGIDDDCDTLVDDADDSVTDATRYYTDADGDGWGDTLREVVDCTPPTGVITQAGDCDDEDATVSPAGQEVCGPADEDCDTLVDDADPSVDPSTYVSWWPDLDADSYGDPSGIAIQSCSAPPGAADNATDCDDQDPLVGPLQAWVLDGDGDGFGAGTPTDPQCLSPGDDWVPEALGRDCNDDNEDISPAAEDICDDGIDQDCDFTDFQGCNDTGGTLTVLGAAEVDELLGTYEGSETFRFETKPSGWVVCEWTWTLLDWASDPTVVGANPISQSCTDPDGNFCRWAHTTHASEGAADDGDYCAFYGMAELGGTYGYGWIDDYQAGGISYGPAMMYFYAPLSVWISVNQTANFQNTSSYSSSTGEFEYEWLDFAVVPAP
jgi:hypothetical protein